MKKVIRLTESELVRLIQQVITEQETSPECQKIVRKIESHKSKGNRLISLVPKKYRETFQRIFEIGIEDGPEAFKNAIPQELRQKFEKVISTLKKPKTDAELESMISDVENDARQIKEQFYGPSWLMPTIMIAGALFILVVLIIGLKNNAGEYCGQSVWWN
jgi:hypothetical protein